MENSLQVAGKLRKFLMEMGKNNALSPDASFALDKDARYIEKSIEILSGGDSDTINSLWREVQYFSRFFGGDYAEGPNQCRLLELMDEFETALLDDIVVMRAKS